MSDTSKGEDRCCIEAHLEGAPAPQWTLPALPAEVIYIDASILNGLRGAYYGMLDEIAAKCGSTLIVKR